MIEEEKEKYNNLVENKTSKPFKHIIEGIPFFMTPDYNDIGNLKQTQNNEATTQGEKIQMYQFYIKKLFPCTMCDRYHSNTGRHHYFVALIHINTEKKTILKNTCIYASCFNKEGNHNSEFEDIEEIGLHFYIQNSKLNTYNKDMFQDNKKQKIN